MTCLTGHSGTRVLQMSLNDWAVLAMVAEQPRHGFAVARELASTAELGSVWRVARPQVYRSLDRLIEAGLVELGASEPGDGPDRRIVAPTAAGRRAVAEWATTPVDRLRKVRAELLVKLVVCRRLRLDGLDLLERQAAVIATIRKTLEQDVSATHDDRRIALLWRQASAEAVDRFLVTARQWWQSQQ